MANCKHCGKEVQPDWQVCPNCATPVMTSEKIEKQQNASIKETSKNSKPLVASVLVVILLFAIYNMFSGSSKIKELPNKPAVQTTTPTQPTQPENKPREKANSWQYRESEDKMNGAKIKFAITESINTLNFDFPYQGTQHARLVLRKNHDGTNDVMITIEKGQFMVSILGGKALVRFDDNAPESFQLLNASDQSTTVVFVKYADYFIDKVVKSKKVYIQTEFYKEGSPVLEFNTEGLNWQ